MLSSVCIKGLYLYDTEFSLRKIYFDKILKKVDSIKL